MRDPDTSAADRDERLAFDGFAMLLEYFGHQGDAVASGYIGKTYETCVAGSSDVYELAEVPVDRDQNPALSGGAFQQPPITWIRFELPGVENVVPLGAQPFGQASACTMVDEELHPLPTVTAARVSSAITACA